MWFDTYGPFEVARTNGLILKDQSRFWTEADLTASRFGYSEGEIARAIGCYALVIRDRGYRPWYVGKTTAAAGFKGEIFQPHKLMIYSEYVSNRRGVPMIFLFPLLTPADRFSKARQTSAPLIDWLEKTLIGMAYAKNARLRNTRGTKYHRHVVVNGILGHQGKGRPTDYAIEARAAFLK